MKIQKHITMTHSWTASIRCTIPKHPGGLQHMQSNRSARTSYHHHPQDNKRQLQAHQHRHRHINQLHHKHHTSVHELQPNPTTPTPHRQPAPAKPPPPTPMANPPRQSQQREEPCEIEPIQSKSAACVSNSQSKAQAWYLTYSNEAPSTPTRIASSSSTTKSSNNISKHRLPRRCT